MRYHKEHRFKVLKLLHENLQNLPPQVVSTNKIADVLQMNIEETRQLLSWMDQTGQIKSNLEGNYTLLTRVGLMEYKKLLTRLFG